MKLAEDLRTERKMVKKKIIVYLAKVCLPASWVLRLALTQAVDAGSHIGQSRAIGAHIPQEIEHFPGEQRDNDATRSA